MQSPAGGVAGTWEQHRLSTDKFVAVPGSGTRCAALSDTDLALPLNPALLTVLCPHLVDAAHLSGVGFFPFPPPDQCFSLPVPRTLHFPLVSLHLRGEQLAEASG